MVNDYIAYRLPLLVDDDSHLIGILSLKNMRIYWLYMCIYIYIYIFICVIHWCFNAFQSWASRIISTCLWEYYWNFDGNVMGLNGIVVGFCRNIMGFHGHIRHGYIMDFYTNVLGFNVKIKGYFIANSNYMSRRSPGWSKSWGMGNFGLNQRVVSSSNMGIELGCVTNDLVVFKICLFVQIVWTLDTVRLIIKQGTNFSSNWSLFWGSPPLIVRVY